MLKGLHLKLGMALLLAAALLLIPRPAPSMAAASDSLPSMLLTLDGIQGSYTAASPKDAIEIHSFSHLAVNTAAPGAGLGGQAAYEDIQIMKPMDHSSLPLLKKLATGETIPNGYLYFQNASAKANTTYMIIHLTNIQVTSYSVSASTGTETWETFSLRAESLLYKYTSLNPDGTAGETQTWPESPPVQPPGGGDTPETSVRTAYHFEPINATTPEGYTYIAGFTVTLNAEAVNSTVKETKYRINGGEWIDYLEPFNIYAEDTHTLEYFSTDTAGDTEPTNGMDFDNGTFTGSGGQIPS